MGNFYCNRIIDVASIIDKWKEKLNKFRSLFTSLILLFEYLTILRIVAIIRKYKNILYNYLI